MSKKIPIELLAPCILTEIVHHVCEIGPVVSHDGLVLQDFLSEHIRSMGDTNWWYHHLVDTTMVVEYGSLLHRWLVLNMLREVQPSDTVQDTVLCWVDSPFPVESNRGGSFLIRAIQDPTEILYASSHTAGDWRCTWQLYLLVCMGEHLPEIVGAAR